MIQFSCPGCRKKFSAKDELAGKKGKCPGCGGLVAIPGAVAVLGQRTPPKPEPANQGGRAEPASSPLLGEHDATDGIGVPTAGHDSSLTDFLAPSQADDELGRLGNYRVLKVLGHGGMGVIYEAEDTRLKRKVALKAMLPALAASPSAGRRFLREAESMAAVEHDHIVRIYQVDEERGVPFLAMEFLKGEPLDKRLRREGKLPVGDVLRIGREMAEALGAAHATGLIHRDVKPANVWLEAPRGRVKLLDFGLARAASGESGLTQQGAILGTPAYMSPEQARSETVDARCDLFSLGVVLYQLCTGEAPFKGKDAISMMMEVALHQPPAPAGVPAGLTTLVMRLLEKDPACRPASAAEAVEALRALESPGDDPTVRATKPAVAVEPGSASRPRAKRGRRRTWLLAVLGLLVVLPLLGWLASFIFHTEAGRTLTEKGDPDRRTAEWVLSVGGEVGVNGQDGGLKTAGVLPRQSFRLTWVSLVGSKEVTDESLARFKGCKNLTNLDLGGTGFSDAGLAHLRDCKNLTYLGLGGTQTSDAGLACFKDCKSLKGLWVPATRISDAGLARFKDDKTLEILWLQETRVTDAGLAYLMGCDNLIALRLQKTQVTAAKVEELKKALPRCKIEWDGGVIEPTEKLRASR